MLLNNKNYKYKFRLKYVFSDFIKISHFFVEKIDKLSLEKKRQLTIPLIREII